jgi:hypothetical protein
MIDPSEVRKTLTDDAFTKPFANDDDKEYFNEAVAEYVESFSTQCVVWDGRDMVVTDLDFDEYHNCAQILMRAFVRDFGMYDFFQDGFTEEHMKIIVDADVFVYDGDHFRTVGEHPKRYELSHYDVVEMGTMNGIIQTLSHHKFFSNGAIFKVI